MLFNRWSGNPDDIQAALTKLIAKETQLAPTAVRSSFTKLRDTLHFSETFFEPLNDMPSHVFDFAYEAGRPITLRVDIDGDRSSPLGMRFTAATAFRPKASLLFCKKTFGYHFAAGDPADIDRMQAQPDLMSPLKRCANAKYANIYVRNAGVTLMPTSPDSEHGGLVSASLMPKDRFGFALFDELGCRQFGQLLDRLDRMA